MFQTFSKEKYLLVFQKNVLSYLESISRRREGSIMIFCYHGVTRRGATAKVEY